MGPTDTSMRKDGSLTAGGGLPVSGDSGGSNGRAGNSGSHSGGVGGSSWNARSDSSGATGSSAAISAGATTTTTTTAPTDQSSYASGARLPDLSGRLKGVLSTLKAKKGTVRAPPIPASGVSRDGQLPAEAGGLGPGAGAGATTWDPASPGGPGEGSGALGLPMGPALSPAQLRQVQQQQEVNRLVQSIVEQSQGEGWMKQSSWRRSRGPWQGRWWRPLGCGA